MPLIKKVALSERDTLIIAQPSPRALPGARRNNWAFSLPQFKKIHLKLIVLKIHA